MDNTKIINRLTALWALSESGLGGMMHAMKIPFTGFFLGGFAVIIVSLLAHYSEAKWRTITRATLLVVLVKALVSPQSPPMAYFAVAFQGLSGAVIYSVGFNRIAAMVYGGIALFESAIQKFITATLFFGMSIWQAFDLFFNSITKDLGLGTNYEFSFWLISIYTGVYTCWGFYLGWFAGGLATSIRQTQQTVQQLLAQSQQIQSVECSRRKPDKRFRLVGLLFLLLFVAGIFIVSGNSKQAWYLVLRTIAVLITLMYLVGPLINYFLNRWIKRKQLEEQHALEAILIQLPQLRHSTKVAMLLAQSSHTGFGVYAAFIKYLLVLAIYQPQE